MPWDFTTAPTSRQLRFSLMFQGVTVQPYASGASDSASRSRQSQLRLTVQGVTVPPHSPGSLNFASQPKQSQPRQSQLRFTTQAVSVQAVSVQAVSTPPHVPSSLSSASQHDTDKVFLSFIADFLQGFLDLNANIMLRYPFLKRFAKNIGVPYAIRRVSQIVFKALDQIL